MWNASQFSKGLSFVIHLHFLASLRVPGGQWRVAEEKRVWFAAVLVKFELNKNVKNPTFFRSRSLNGGIFAPPPLSVGFSWPFRTHKAIFGLCNLLFYEALVLLQPHLK